MNFKSILIILICIFLFYIINLAINKKESFTSFSPDKILENCKDNFGKDYKNQDCNKSAFVSEPGYLCGICGDDSKNPVTMIRNSKEDKLNYYGCGGTKIYNNGLSWNTNKETITLNKLLAEKITCNNTNKESISNMYLYVCADDLCTKITIDGNSNRVTPVNRGSWKNMNSYFIENIKYGTEVEILVENTGGNGGFCISYIWNKQLYILDNNGFQNTANIINYTSKNNVGWDLYWYNTNQITNLFPWMHNWIKIDNPSNFPKYGSIKFKIGDTQKNGFMTNDITVFLGIDDNGSVLLNGNPIYNKSKQEWNKSIFFNIPNVKDNAKLEFKCINTGGPGGIGVAYLRSGYLFTLPSSVAGFNSVANIMKYTQKNCNGLTYDPSSIKNNLSFLTSWENTSVVGDFSLTTNIGESIPDTWTYPKSNKWMIIEQNKNPIYKWKDLNISSNSNMSISFLLYISNTYNNWRNIFHISNNNNDCCNIGDRVPGLWIYPKSTRLLLVNDIKMINNNKQVGVSTNDGIRLNRDCFITMTWSNTTVSIYENGLLKASRDYKLPLIAAIPEASFYIGDPWYKANEGIQIKDFTIYNYVLSQRQIKDMYKK